MVLFLSRHGVEEFLAAAEHVSVAAAFRDFEDIVGFQAIDHEIAVEVGAENVLRNLLAASALAGADDINGGLLTAEDP
jgi:hypothetical protein